MKPHLEAPITNAGNHTLLVRTLSIAKQCTN